jgi:16S rRNA (guanine966-N2)-methyltransferase
MQVKLRIVAGALRGRLINCQVNPALRPTPQMVREALFSILGNAVPARPFYDVFAGTGANGLEAISRGASFAYFIERDVRYAYEIDKHLASFGVAKQAQVVRTDVYRWAAQWQAPPEPVNLFVSPPFIDFERRTEEMAEVLRQLYAKAADESVIIVQTERQMDKAVPPDFVGWEERRYGRNVLFLKVKQPPGDESMPEPIP